MSKLRRYFSGNEFVFLTVVTHKRQPILIDHVDLLHTAITTAGERLSFTLTAWVILPDHFHVIIEATSANPSDILQRIKLSFSAHLRKQMGLDSGRVWQHRFWDHHIRNQSDFSTHIDYIHYNPVRHGYCRKPLDWLYSSLHEYVADGYYSKDWGNKKRIEFAEDFGE